jgi:phage gp29-like protein
MNLLKTLFDKLVPMSRRQFLGPRWEPMNISSTATVQTVQAAIRAAENGETRELFRLYRDAALSDDHIQGEWNKRKLAVLATPLTVAPRTKGDADDIVAAAAGNRMIDDCENWIDGLNALESSTLWPVAVVENIFRPADPQPVDVPGGGQIRLLYTLKRLELVNPILLCFRHAYMVGGVGMGTATPVQNIGAVSVNPWDFLNMEDFEPFVRIWPTDASGFPVYDISRASKLDPVRYIVHRGHLLTQFRDNWGGPARCVLAWWLLRGLGRDWFAQFMERYGSPYPVAKTNVQDEQSVNFLKEAFAVASKVHGLVIGQQDEVTLQAAAVQGGAEGHALWHDTCNRAISRLIVGQDLSASAAATGMGSGVANLQGQVRQDIRQMDEAKLAETLERFFLKACQINGLKGRVRCIFGGLSTADQKAYADMLVSAGQAGFEPTDEAMTTVQEKLGLQVQRKAAALTGPSVTGFSAPQTSLIALSARVADPVDAALAPRVEALSAAYRGAMAPFRQAILASASRADCLHRLQALYPDWSPTRLTAEMETALQIAAASGAAKAVEK